MQILASPLRILDLPQESQSRVSAIFLFPRAVREISRDSWEDLRLRLGNVPAGEGYTAPFGARQCRDL